MSAAPRAPIARGVPVKYAGDPMDIANVARYLVSDEASYVLDAVLAVFVRKADDSRIDKCDAVRPDYVAWADCERTIDKICGRNGGLCQGCCVSGIISKRITILLTYRRSSA